MTPKVRRHNEKLQTPVLGTLRKEGYLKYGALTKDEVYRPAELKWETFYCAVKIEFGAIKNTDRLKNIDHPFFFSKSSIIILAAIRAPTPGGSPHFSNPLSLIKAG